MNKNAEWKVNTHGLDDRAYKQIRVDSFVRPFTKPAENGIVLIMT